MTGDQRPTRRLTLAEIHGLGSWPIAIAALDAISPEWIPILRRGILFEIRRCVYAMEADLYPPELVERLERYVQALRQLEHPATLAAPLPPPPTMP